MTSYWCDKFDLHWWLCILYGEHRLYDFEGNSSRVHVAGICNNNICVINACLNVLNMMIILLEALLVMGCKQIDSVIQIVKCHGFQPI